MFNITVILLVLTILAHITLGLLVFFNKPSAAINRLLFSLSINVSLWTLTVLMVSISINYLDIIFWIRASHALGILVPCHVYVLTHLFTMKNKYPYKGIIPFLLVGLVFSGLSMTPFVVYGLNEPIIYKAPLFNVLYQPYLLFYSGMIILSAILLFLRQKEARGVMLIQLRLLIAAILIPLLLSTMFNAVLPLAGITHFRMIDLRSLSPVFSLILVSVLTYVILRYRFMDIRFAFRKYLSTITTAMFLAGISLLLVRILFRWNSGIDFFTAEVIIATVVISVVIGLPLIKDGIQAIFNRLLFNSVKDYHQVLPNKVRSLENTLELNTYLNSLVIEITETMELERGFYCRKDSDGEYCPSESKGASHSDLLIDNDLVNLKQLVKAVETQKNILLRSDLKQQNLVEGQVLLEGQMEKAGVEVIVPLKDENETGSIIFLGDKKTGEPFYQEDVDLLSSIASQVTSTLINARLYEEILAIKQYLENILLNMGNSLIAINEEEVITVFNAEAEFIFGISADNALGQKLFPFMNKDIYLLFQETLGKGKGINHVEIKLKIDQKTRYLTCNTAIVESPEKRNREIIIVLSDITRIKELEQERSKSERLASLGEVAAGIAHEIKNPLVSIKTFADLLPEKYEDDDFRHTFSNVVSQEITRINDLVGELLRFVKEPVLNCERVNINGLIDEVISLLSPQLEAGNIVIIYQYQEEHLTASVDRSLLKQALLNICLNSVQAMPNGGKLIVGAMYSDSNLTIQIEDTGPGIADSIRDKIFDPFVTDKADGVGLGLSICHKIISAHRGRIIVKSDEDRGSRFEIVLPRS